jgi:hypothetical protein
MRIVIFSLWRVRQPVRLMTYRSMAAAFRWRQMTPAMILVI